MDPLTCQTPLDLTTSKLLQQASIPFRLLQDPNNSQTEELCQLRRLTPYNQHHEASRISNSPFVHPYNSLPNTTSLKSKQITTKSEEIFSHASSFTTAEWFLYQVQHNDEIMGNFMSEINNAIKNLEIDIKRHEEAHANCTRRTSSLASSHARISSWSDRKPLPQRLGSWLGGSSWDDCLQQAFTHLEIVRSANTEYLLVGNMTEIQHSDYTDLAKQAPAYECAATTILAAYTYTFNDPASINKHKDQIAYFLRLYDYLLDFTIFQRWIVTRQQRDWDVYSRQFHKLFSATNEQQDLDILPCPSRTQKIKTMYTKLRSRQESENKYREILIKEHKAWISSQREKI